MTSEITFKLDDEFVKQYDPESGTKQQPNFGFNGLGQIAYLRTYARYSDKLGRQEMWHETIERVINGVFTMQKRHCLTNGLAWNEDSKRADAQRMYDKFYHMKFLPPGRGIWAMGTSITVEKELFSALNNCAFVSTDV